MVKLYYVCECCDGVFDEMETAGEGVAEVRALCPDCAEEMGMGSSPSRTNRFFYN